MERIIKVIKTTFRLKTSSATVRFMFPAIISFAALLGAAVVTSNDASFVRLESSEKTVEAGKQFYVDVYAYAHVPVNAVDITLKFDPAMTEVLGVDTGQSVLTIWTQEPVINNDSVSLQGGTFRKGFLKEHKIATINLRAKKTGQSSFYATDVVMLRGDGKGTPVQVAEAIDSKTSLYIYGEGDNLDTISITSELKVITDLDGSGSVTLKDISMFMSAWHNKDKLYDFNNDGKMSFRDFSIILANYLF